MVVESEDLDGVPSRMTSRVVGNPGFTIMIQQCRLAPTTGAAGDSPAALPH